jgi:hypothetical protein
MNPLQVLTWEGDDAVVQYDTNPDSCPICHSHIHPIDSKCDCLVGMGMNRVLERVLRCPRRDCQRLFIARYRPRDNSNSYYLLYSVPFELADHSFDPSLKTISPDFCSIYNEAQKAEQLQLKLVCGPGYRKALEFLIKDYVSKLHPTPEDKTKIEKMPLMTCITEYVKDPKVQAMAARAVWLGNDETHYLRKWDGKDLKDLESLIQLTCYWIMSDQLTNDAVLDMPEGKK